MKLLELLQTLEKHQNESEQFINSIPPSLRSSVHDNEYVGAQSFQIQALIEFIFKDDLIIDLVYWFLWERRPEMNNSYFIKIDDEEFNLKTTEDISNFIVNYLNGDFS